MWSLGVSTFVGPMTAAGSRARPVDAAGENAPVSHGATASAANEGRDTNVPAATTPAPPTATSPAVPGAAAAAPKSDELASLRKLVAAVVASVLHLPLGHADVQDAVQECMRRAVEGRSRLRDGEPLRPWVVGIARHVALDVHRARKRQPSALPESDASAPELEIADPAPSALERFASEEQSRAVRQALSTLPEGARRALTMFHLEGKRYEEISVALGVPMGTVATWMARGRKAVAQAMRREPEPS